MAPAPACRPARAFPRSRSGCSGTGRPTTRSGRRWRTARRATAHEANLLQAPRTATVLTMTRTTFDHEGNPVEHGSHAYLADRYSFKMTLVSQ